MEVFFEALRRPFRFAAFPVRIFFMGFSEGSGPVLMALVLAEAFLWASQKGFSEGAYQRQLVPTLTNHWDMVEAPQFSPWRVRRAEGSRSWPYCRVGNWLAASVLAPGFRCSFVQTSACRTSHKQIWAFTLGCTEVGAFSARG